MLLYTDNSTTRDGNRLQYIISEDRGRFARMEVEAASVILTGGDFRKKDELLAFLDERIPKFLSEMENNLDFEIDTGKYGLNDITEKFVESLLSQCKQENQMSLPDAEKVQFQNVYVNSEKYKAVSKHVKNIPSNLCIRLSRLPQEWEKRVLHYMPLIYAGYSAANTDKATEKLFGFLFGVLCPITEELCVCARSDLTSDELTVLLEVMRCTTIQRKASMQRDILDENLNERIDVVRIVDALVSLQKHGTIYLTDEEITIVDSIYLT